MAKFLLVLTIFLALAAAGLGWLTKTKIDEQRTKLSQTLTTLKDTKGELVKTQQTLADTETKLSAAQDTIHTDEATIATKTDTITQDEKKIADVQTQLDTANKAMADLQQKFQDLLNKYKGQGQQGQPVDIDTMIQNFKNQINELTQLNQTLTKEKEADDAKVKAMIDKETERVKKLMQPGVEGIVMAVNPGYGFAVVSVGDKQGAVPNAELLVKRGGVLIARLRITTVEPVLSVADIIPDSLAKGQRVLPGDKVIFTGNLAQ